MDPLQERLARIGLRVIGERGFVLGGGHAVELHGMGARPSEDIDLFTAERGSPAAVAGNLRRLAGRLTLEVPCYRKWPLHTSGDQGYQA